MRSVRTIGHHQHDGGGTRQRMPSTEGHRDGCQALVEPRIVYDREADCYRVTHRCACGVISRTDGNSYLFNAAWAETRPRP